VECSGAAESTSLQFRVAWKYPPGSAAQTPSAVSQLVGPCRQLWLLLVPLLGRAEGLLGWAAWVRRQPGEEGQRRGAPNAGLEIVY